jgi:hypothetical protein
MSQNPPASFNTLCEWFSKIAAGTVFGHGMRVMPVMSVDCEAMMGLVGPIGARARRPRRITGVATSRQ